MADRTAISWADATWNPTRGCTRISEGCRHCYAEIVAARFSHPGQPYEGLAVFHGPPEKRQAQWTGEIRIVPEHLDDPLRWRKPRRIFVNSMSDLFHEALPDADIDRIFIRMALATHHQFLILTKRPQRMRHYMTPATELRRESIEQATYNYLHKREPMRRTRLAKDFSLPWPLPNVWLGVSVEDQSTADQRIPVLLDTPAAIRFISAEPLLGPIDLSRARRWPITDPSTGQHVKLNWVIIGGESGPHARPMEPTWAAHIIADCRRAHVPVFMKQAGNRLAREWGCTHAKGDIMNEWPEPYRIQEWPRTKSNPPDPIQTTSTLENPS